MPFQAIIITIQTNSEYLSSVIITIDEGSISFVLSPLNMGCKQPI